MPQQINLCTPLFLTQKHQVSAKVIFKGLAIFIVLGASLSSYWAWSLQHIDATYRQSMGNNQQELTRLQAAIKTAKAHNAPADAAMTQSLQQQRDELQQREQLLTELRRGLSGEGRGHSARLLLVAQTIPPQVWVTEIKADDLRIELSGFTLEPAALNVWMDRLAQSPLLQGQQLAAVKVERSVSELRQDSNTAPITPVALNKAKTARPGTWSYNIVSAVAVPKSFETNGSKP
jgi:Tfp pilus assembly protein PilN